MKKTICLNMIVKNETHIIKRCFDSLKDYIDYWVISDTGSTDGTQEYIRSYFKEVGIPGELVEHEWEDFSSNRNFALKAALGKSDYILFMDADDYIEWRHDSGFSKLESDAYMLPMLSHNTAYSNIKIIKSNSAWKWEGVLHEVLTCSLDYTSETYYESELVIRSTREGARNRDPDKYLKDAAVLEKALLTEKDNSRYQFYLARSYYDADRPDKAMYAFERRVSMGGWVEEVYYSLLSAARCKNLMNLSTDQVIDAYIKSYLYRPERLEGLYEAIRLCRVKGYYSLGYQIGKLVKDTKLPDDVLFVDKQVYDWKFLDEFSICAIQTGHGKEVLAFLAHIISLPTTPADQLERLKKNLAVAVGF